MVGSRVASRRGHEEPEMRNNKTPGPIGPNLDDLFLSSLTFETDARSSDYRPSCEPYFTSKDCSN